MLFYKQLEKYLDLLISSKKRQSGILPSQTTILITFFFIFAIKN